jgi:hypothetical protein
MENCGWSIPQARGVRAIGNVGRNIPADVRQGFARDE